MPKSAARRAGGSEVIKLASRIARDVGVPLYIHLGQLWPARDGSNVDPDEVVREVVPLNAARRRAGASVHAPSGWVCFGGDRPRCTRWCGRRWSAG